MLYMKLLISTPHFILGYSTQTKKVEVLESGPGQYYGISWSPDGQELAWSFSGVDDTTLIDLAAYAQSERGGVCIGRRRSWPCLSAPHQILWISEDYLLATNTGRNALTRISTEDFNTIQYRYDDSLWDRLSLQGTEGSHFNSLFHRGERIYLVAHNHTKASAILELEWPTLKYVSEQKLEISGIHNLWVTDDEQWVVCDSKAGGLLDARTNTVLWSNGRQGYTRGLAATASIIVVGNSEFAPVRSNRRNFDAGLWIIDRKSWETLDYVSLGHYGGVNDVRIIDEPDYCHHGVPLSASALNVLNASRLTIREQRLVRARENHALRGWDILDAGAPVRLRGPAITSESGGHVTGMLRGVTQYDVSLAAELHILGSNATDHASLVTRYIGPSDTNMCAGLFQFDGIAVTAAIWQHNGEWHKLAETNISAASLPLRTQDAHMVLPVQFTTIGQQASIQIGGQKKITANLTHSMNTRQTRAGIRIHGSTFGFSAVSARA